MNWMLNRLSMMEVKDTSIANLKIIKPKIFEDERGFFSEFYNRKEFIKHNIPINFVQDNHSFSRKGVLRGLHYQDEHPQDKLIKVISGMVFDVAVDLRESSDTFGKYFGIVLSQSNKKMLFIPKGFAHGYLALTNEVQLIYKVTGYYCSKCENGIRWNDPKINIDWPFSEYEISQPKISKKDKQLSFL